jgi:tripartite-type tricarboxylate transporter receptor subunit TctC
MGILAPPEVMGQVQAGRIRLIGVTTLEPSPLVPGVPTVASTVPGFNVIYWVGLAAPSGVPDAIVQRVSAALTEVLALPEVKARMTDLGGAAATGETAAFAALLAGERVTWREAVAASGVRVE